MWPVVRARCADGDALVSDLLEQEHQLKLALHDLDKISPGSEEFVECLHTVASHERTHLSYEQNQVWPRLFDELNDGDLVELTAAWQAARRTAPTRPHPHLPVDRATLRIALPVLAAFDRLTGRWHGSFSRSKAG